MSLSQSYYYAAIPTRRYGYRQQCCPLLLLYYYLSISVSFIVFVGTIESTGIIIIYSIITTAVLYAILPILVPRTILERRYRPLGIIIT